MYMYMYIRIHIQHPYIHIQIHVHERIHIYVYANTYICLYIAYTYIHGPMARQNGLVSHGVVSGRAVRVRAKLFLGI